MIDIEHPDITKCLEHGYHKPQPKRRYCSVCGEEVDIDTKLYVDDNYRVVGCENCTTQIDSEQYFND